MQPRAGHLPNGIEPRQAGGGLQIRGNTTHPVVSGRCNGNGPLQGIQAKFPATVEDCREAVFSAIAMDRSTEPSDPTEITDPSFTNGKDGTRMEDGTVIEQHLW